MKIITLKFKIIIGVILFIVLVGAGFCATIFNKLNSSNNTYTTEFGEKVYKGQLMMPVENFNVVTSKYGYRIHPINRKTELSYRD